MFGIKTSISTVFHVSRVFIAITAIGFRPFDHLVAGYRMFNWPRTASLPNAKLALARVGITSRPSSLDLLQWVVHHISERKITLTYLQL